MHVFVRTWDGRVAHRGGPHGRHFSPWQRLEGPVSTLTSSPRIVDGLDACVDSEGLIHLAAPTVGTVQHWVSKELGRLPRRPRPPGCRSRAARSASSRWPTARCGPSSGGRSPPRS
ncbi:hypothetical protein O1L68_25835 [Streptomyces lydicus]|nr:hypothetical protein [Streptomyces lydicus]